MEPAYNHEGFVAFVLADGRLTSSSTSGGVIVHDLTAADIAADRCVNRYDNSDYIDVIVPWSEVAAWQVTCSCGWTGAQRAAYATPGWTNERDCPEAVEDAEFRPDWEAHVAPYAALADLPQQWRALRLAEIAVNETVASARHAGASWTDISRAVGMSRQGAQQRWG